MEAKKLRSTKQGSHRGKCDKPPTTIVFLFALGNKEGLKTMGWFPLALKMQAPFLPKKAWCGGNRGCTNGERLMNGGGN